MKLGEPGLTFPVRIHPLLLLRVAIHWHACLHGAPMSDSTKASFTCKLQDTEDPTVWSCHLIFTTASQK